MLATWFMTRPSKTNCTNLQDPRHCLTDNLIMQIQSILYEKLFIKMPCLSCFFPVKNLPWRLYVCFYRFMSILQCWRIVFPCYQGFYFGFCLCVYYRCHEIDC